MAHLPKAPDSTKQKRLTIDIPESLHRKIKVACAKRGVTMATEVRRMLEKRFGNERG